VRNLVLVSVAAASWGTTGSVSTILAEQASASPLLVGAARMSIAAVLLVAASLATRAPRLPRGCRTCAVAMGTCMAGYQVSFFAAVPLAGIAVSALVAICSAPLIIALLARGMLGERLPARAILALTAGLAGTALLIAGGRTSGQTPERFGVGALLALAAGASYAMYAVLAKRSLERTAPLTVATATFVVAAAILLPMLLLVQAPGQQIALGWPWLLYLGAIATAGAYAAYAIGLREVPASVAGILALAEPLTAALLGVAVFGERLSLAGALGAALVWIAWPPGPPSTIESVSAPNWASDGAAKGAVGDHGGMLARTPGHEHEDLVGGEDLGHEGVVVARGPHPRGPVVHSPHTAELEEAERKARVLEDELLHVAPREPVAGDGGRVLGAEDEHELTLRHEPPDVRAQRHRGVDHRGENARRGGRHVVVHVVRRLTAEHGDDVIGVEGPPRRGFGQNVIEQIVPRALNGSGVLDFSPAGVNWTFEFLQRID
jgi:DME family drug/metabolite transporter